MDGFKSKTFWERPEGITGGAFLAAIILALGVLTVKSIAFVITALTSGVGLIVSLLVLGTIIFTALDPKARNLVWYMYKSAMRAITGIFVKMDPIAILKGYVSDLKENLRKMNRQISMLRGQMHKLQELILNNRKEIQSNLTLASQAKETDKQAIMILKSRKAGRLKESNMKLEDLYKKMEILYRVLGKMYENSEVMLEDIQDQVEIKDQERKAMYASNSAMKSAMSIITGNGDKRVMFDMALEAVADDVANKVGEMERFMDLSENFMKSVDLQNGIFEEEGLKMLEKWENEGVSSILGEQKQTLLKEAADDSNVLDINAPLKRPEKVETRRNQYDSFFEE
jgi:TolA-binding protein